MNPNQSCRDVEPTDPLAHPERDHRIRHRHIDWITPDSGQLHQVIARSMSTHHLERDPAQ